MCKTQPADHTLEYSKADTGTGCISSAVYPNIIESIASTLNANVQDYKNILSIQSEMTNAEAIIQRGD